MQSKSKRKGTQIKKKRIPKYNDGGRPTNVTELLDYLDRYQGQTMVPTSDPYNLPAAQVNLPAAEVITDRSDPTYVNAMLPERIARTEGDLAAVYRNLGSQGVTDYLDMTQGVIDAQNRGYEAIELPLYFTPFGTPALINRMLADGVDADDLPSIVAAASSAAMRKMPSGPAVGGVLRQGAEDVRNFFRRMMGKDPKYTARTSDIVDQPGRMASEMERFASGLTPEGARRMDMLRRRPSSSGMFSAAEEAAMEAEILTGEESVFGQKGLPGSPEMPRIEGQNISFRRNINQGEEMARKAASKMPYKVLRDMTSADYQALAPSGDEDRATAFINELGKIQHRQHADVYGNTTQPVQQIPALMIGGELEKRANQQGMIPKAQLDQFLEKGGLSTFDKAVLEQAMMQLGTVPGKKGKEFYNLRDLRNFAAANLQERFVVSETNSYTDYGTGNLRGPKNEIQSIGTKLIVADRQSEIGKSYIGASSGHWREISPDIVAHYRGFVRGGNLADTRTLYISEMQSDVAQSGRFLKDSYDYVKDFPQDIMRQAPDENGVMRYTYQFPDDAYDSARRYAFRNLPEARNPHELFFDIPAEFDIEATAPSGYEDVMEQIKDVMGDGVITPENEFLYDVNYWMGVKDQVRDLYRTYRDLNKNSKGIANKFYQEAIKVWKDGHPGLELEWLDSTSPDLSSIAIDMEIAIEDIIEALQKNDVNPPGTFTDAYIQSSYDQSLESLKDLLERQQGQDSEMAMVFHDGTYRDMEIGTEYPAQDEKIQSHFVKNQDEFLLSQIIQQNSQYKAIRFPTGQTTGIIQGFFRSPERFEREIQRTRDEIENLRGDVTRANNLINNSEGGIEGFKSVFQDGSTTYFGDQIDALGPTTQELLFGTKIVGADGKPRFTDIDGYVQSIPRTLPGLEQVVNDPAKTESAIYEGKVSPEMQKDVHLYNFLTFVNAFQRGRVRTNIADLRAQEFTEAALDVARTIPREPGRLHSNVNYVMQTYAVDPKYPKTGQDMLGKYERFKGSGDMEDVITSFIEKVERYTDQQAYDYNDFTGTPSIPRLETEAYLNGDFLEHPAYKNYMDMNDPGGRSFQEKVILEFSKHLELHGNFNPWRFSDELEFTVGDLVYHYIENYTIMPSNSASQIAKNQKTHQLTERTFGVPGAKSLGWNSGWGLGYGEAQKLIFMPIAPDPSGPPPPRAFIQEPGYMVTESELQDFLARKAVELNKLGGAIGDNAARTFGVTKFRSEIENLGYSLKVGSFSHGDIAAKQSHLQSQEDQLRAILNGEGIRDDLKTVMNSYDRLPKIAKKMGYNLTPVTDQHGNEWFELKLPQSIQRGEGEVRGYKYGGRVRVKKRKPMKVIKR